MNNSLESHPRDTLPKNLFFVNYWREEGVLFVRRIQRLILCFVLRDSQFDTAVVFSVGTLDSSVQPRAHKHLQKRRQSRSNPRAWLTATCLGGQFSTGSDLCSVSLHFSFHLYRDFQESTCFTSRVPTHCVDLNLP